MKKSISRAWLVLALCALAMVALSLGVAAPATNLSVLREARGLTAVQTSMFSTITRITAIVFFLFGGWVFERYKASRLLVVALISMTTAFFVLSFCGSSIFLIYFASVCCGISYSLGWMTTGSLIFANWFKKGYGTALAIFSAGSGITNIVWSPIINRLNIDFGSKYAFLVEALFVLCVTALVAFFVPNSPNDVGEKPYGADELPESDRPSEAMETKKLDMHKESILLFAALLTGIAGITASNLSLCYISLGFDSTLVATAMSMYGFIILGMKVYAGRLLDRLGNRKMTMIIGGIEIVGIFMCFLAMFVRQSVWMFAAVFVYAAGVPIHSLSFPNWSTDLTSAEESFKLKRNVQLCVIVGEIVGSIIMGITADATGVYSWGYLISGLGLTIGLSTVCMIYKQVRK